MPSRTDRITDPAAFLAAQKVWEPKPNRGGRPSVPRTRKAAGRRFRCTDHDCVLTGRNCAARWLATAGNRSNNFSNGPNAVRVWTGHCSDCTAGERRVELLEVTPDQLDATMKASRERGRRAYLASLPDRVATANEAIAGSYGEDNEQRTARRRAVEYRRRGLCPMAEGGADLLPRLTSTGRGGEAR